MKREFYNQYSDVLHENMSMLVYGEGGYPVIAFQCQDAKSNNFEDFGMIDVLAPFIEDGRIQVFSVDNLDEQSWSDEGGDKGARAWRQEEYFRFVTDELLPRVHAWNNSDRRPLAVGCSMGATHAAIAALRRPDLFQGCIALSGVYSTSFFFGNWMDENLYNNDIPAFLTNMPVEHPYVKLYNQRQLVMCVGQGAWEMGVDDLRYIDSQLNRLGVKHWCDFWGTDVNHDWPWWRKQMPYFMNEVLTEIEGQAQAEAAKALELEFYKAEQEAAAAAEEAATVAEEPKAEQEAAAVAEEPKAEQEATAAPEEPKATKKPAAKRTTTRKASTAKKAAEATIEAAAEAETTEAPAAAKPAAKRATTRRAAKKTTEAAAKTAEAKAPEAEATEAPAAAKPAAKRATTRRSTKKAAEAATETAEAKPAAKTTTRRASTRRSTKKTDATE